MKRVLVGLGLMVLALCPALPVDGQSRSLRVPIGTPAVRDGLRIAAGYLPWPAPLDPPPGQGSEGDLGFHLQIDVDAVAGNPYGLDADDPVPYLRIAFAVNHAPTGRRHEGVLAPMLSRDGFHYGANVPLPASGTYTLSIELRPPEGLARHTDARTGVQKWWNPFTLTWSFDLVVQ